MRSCTIRVEAIIGSAAIISTATAAIALSHQMLFLIIDAGMFSQRLRAASWATAAEAWPGFNPITIHFKPM